MNPRCVSVNSQIECDFFQNLIYPQAVLIDDIDEDGKNELVLGTANGEIFAYKGTLASTWVRYPKQIGCITCLAFDNVINEKKKLLIALDAIGTIYLFAVDQIRRRYASDITATKQQISNDFKLDLRLVNSYKLLINPMHIVIDDFYNNGSKDLIIGYSDRMVRLFHWQAALATIVTATPSAASSSNLPSHYSLSDLQKTENGRFILEHSWELPDQIYSINMVRNPITGQKHLLATQPGGIVMLCRPQSANLARTDSSTSSSSSSLIELTNSGNSTSTTKTIQQPTSSFRFEKIAHFNSSETTSTMEKMPTFLVTNVNYQQSTQYAFLIKMNGDVVFFKLDFSSGSVSTTQIWSKSINALVLKHMKIDINKDGNDELILASPDGQIYVINCAGDYICFDLGEPIRVFQMGMYSSTLSGSGLAAADSLTDNTSVGDQASLHAFEMALDQQQPQFDDTATTTTSNNALSIIFVSALTNKICLLQVDTILQFCKPKHSLQLKYKCENIFTKRRFFSAKLNKLLENNNVDDRQSFLGDVYHDILYSC